MTEEELKEHQQRIKGGKPHPAPAKKAPAPAPDKTPTKQTGQRRLQALGRLKPGEMNRTEARYAAHLENEKQAGRILWYAFEAVKLKLAHNTHLTVDFFVLLADGRLEAHDVKGAKAIFTDDARAKMKIAADKFPWQFAAVYPKNKKDGEGWDREDF